MTFAAALTVAGVLFQIIGAVVALAGLAKTHDAYAEKSVRTLLGERSSRAKAWLVSKINRLLHRKHLVAVDTGSAVSTATAFRARALVTWGPLDPSLSQPDATRELDRRIRDLVDRVNRFEGQVLDDAEGMLKSISDLRDEIAKGDQTLRLLVRSAAIEGLLWEAVGLFLVIVGSALQGWGAFASLAP